MNYIKRFVWLLVLIGARFSYAWSLGVPSDQDKVIDQIVERIGANAEAEIDASIDNPEDLFISFYFEKSLYSKNNENLVRFFLSLLEPGVDYQEEHVYPTDEAFYTPCICCVFQYLDMCQNKTPRDDAIAQEAFCSLRAALLGYKTQIACDLENSFQAHLKDLLCTEDRDVNSVLLYYDSGGASIARIAQVASQASYRSDLCFGCFTENEDSEQEGDLQRSPLQQAGYGVHSVSEKASDFLEAREHFNHKLKIIENIATGIQIHNQTISEDPQADEEQLDDFFEPLTYLNEVIAYMHLNRIELLESVFAQDANPIFPAIEAISRYWIVHLLCDLIGWDLCAKLKRLPHETFREKKAFWGLLPLAFHAYTYGK